MSLTVLTLIKFSANLRTLLAIISSSFLCGFCSMWTYRFIWTQQTMWCKYTYLMQSLEQSVISLNACSITANYQICRLWSSWHKLLDQELDSSCSSSGFLLGRSIQKSLRFCHFKSDQDEIWHVLPVNVHQLTELDFRSDVTFKIAEWIQSVWLAPIWQHYASSWSTVHL